MAFPDASGTRYFFFCASVPNLKMWLEHSELCAAMINPTEPSTRASLFDLTQPRPAILFRKDHAEQAHFRELRNNFHRKMGRFIPLHHVRCDFALGEFPHTAA